MHALKKLAQPRASHSGSCFTLAAAPILFAHAVVKAAKNKYDRIHTPTIHQRHTSECSGDAMGIGASGDDLTAPTLRSSPAQFETAPHSYTINKTSRESDKRDWRANIVFCIVNELAQFNCSAAAVISYGSTTQFGYLAHCVVEPGLKNNNNTEHVRHCLADYQ